MAGTNSPGRYFGLGCLTSLVLLILSIIAFVVWAVSHIDRKDTIPEGTWLTLNISGNIGEYSELKDPLFLKHEPLTVHDIVTKLDMAAKDSRIRGIILKPGYIGADNAQLHRIQDALIRFKSTGKPLYAFIDQAGNRDYMLAATADSIFINPSATSSVMFTGIGGSILFWKDTLAKIGVKMKVFQVGKYKGATDLWADTKLSPPLRENYQAMIDTLYDNYLSNVTQYRGKIRIDSLRVLFENRRDFFITPQQALSAKLADRAAYLEDVYSAHGIDKEHRVSIRNYSDDTFVYPNSSPENRIAIVYMNGPISVTDTEYEGGTITSDRYNRLFATLESESSVKAVVLRIDSPGGGAYASDLIAHRLDRLRKTKPVVTSVGGMAASGGYYIGCTADYIVAEPASIIGSIGVYSMLPDATGLRDKIGVRTDRVSRGKFVSPGNLFFEADPAFDQSLLTNAMLVYEEFKHHVGTHRKAIEDVESVAQGMIFTGRAAMEKGLVDGMGNLDTAITKAAELAGLPSYEIAWYPEQRSLYDLIVEETIGTDEVKSMILDSFLETHPVMNELTELEQLVVGWREETWLMLSPFTLD